MRNSWLCSLPVQIFIVPSIHFVLEPIHNFLLPYVETNIFLLWTFILHLNMCVELHLRSGLVFRYN